MAPKDLRALNRLELFNEALIYITMMHLIFFFPGFLDVELGYKAGFFMIGVISVVIAVNLYQVFYHGLRSFALIYKRYYGIIWAKYFRKKRKSGSQILQE